MSEGFGAAARDYRNMIWQECGRKRHYRSEKHARDVALSAYWRRDQELYAYRCRLCDGWHVGHRPKDQSVY